MTNTYQANEVAAFMRSREAYGDLSNMTGGMPIRVNGIRFQSSEGLYQALKFPNHPELQQRIGDAPGGMAAKRVAYLEDNPAITEGWEHLRYDAMRLALAEKLRQNPQRFAAALEQTGCRPIVEKSYRDQYWGARPEGSRLVGANTLGQLLELLRLCLRQHDGEAAQAAQSILLMTDTRRLFVNGRPAASKAMAA